jgi:hypothetical protein
MKSFTQQLSSQSNCSRLVSTLRGDVLEHLQSHIDADIILPHGVGDWTTTHHMCNHRTCVSPPPYHPIYFHVETHLAGTVNWRTQDVHINVDLHTHRNQQFQIIVSLQLLLLLLIGFVLFLIHAIFIDLILPCPNSLLCNHNAKQWESPIHSAISVNLISLA